MKILFAGESWTILTTHVKGFDLFQSASYDESSCAQIQSICESAGMEFDYMPAHRAIREFPGYEGLLAYDVVVLSDIGSDTFLLHPDTAVLSLRRENRLTALCDYVRQGGGLAMFGGWNSFQGMGMKARYGCTPLASVLPVEMYPYDDRNETPEGSVMTIEQPDHPIFQDVDMNWPAFLGYNRLKAKEGADVLATNGDDAMITVQTVGKGRVCAYASDITTHWAPHELTDTPSYARFIVNLFTWLGEARR